MTLTTPLFPRHFNSFLNLIHSLNGVNWTVLSSIHKQGLSRHVTSLREVTIKAMSNMLTANIDSGLTHAIGVWCERVGVRRMTPFLRLI